MTRSGEVITKNWGYAGVLGCVVAGAVVAKQAVVKNSSQIHVWVTGAPGFVVAGAVVPCQHAGSRFVAFSSGFSLYSDKYLADGERWCSMGSRCSIRRRCRRTSHRCTLLRPG